MQSFKEFLAKQDVSESNLNEFEGFTKIYFAKIDKDTLIYLDVIKKFLARKGNKYLSNVDFKKAKIENSQFYKLVVEDDSFKINRYRATLEISFHLISEYGGFLDGVAIFWNIKLKDMIQFDDRYPTKINDFKKSLDELQKSLNKLEDDLRDLCFNNDKTKERIAKGK